MGDDTIEQTVKLSRLEDHLETLSYPLTRAEAITACEGTTLVLADGTQAVAEVIRQSTADSFASADELTNEIMSLLPRRAVGEPYQSEGEG